METFEQPEFLFCDFKNPEHREAFVELLDHYMKDPMGGSQSLNKSLEKKLLEGMASHPSVFVLFVKVNGKFVGFTTCFTNFSTFKAMPYINIHDVLVLNELRSKGIGRKLLEKVAEIAKERGCCKITLEVRDDNTSAKFLYQELGFKECVPVMHYWEKLL